MSDTVVRVRIEAVHCPAITVAHENMLGQSLSFHGPIHKSGDFWVADVSGPSLAIANFIREVENLDGYEPHSSMSPKTSYTQAQREMLESRRVGKPWQHRPY